LGFAASLAAADTGTIETVKVSPALVISPIARASAAIWL